MDEVDITNERISRDWPFVLEEGKRVGTQKKGPVKCAKCARSNDRADEGFCVCTACMPD